MTVQIPDPGNFGGKSPMAEGEMAAPNRENGYQIAWGSCVGCGGCVEFTYKETKLTLDAIATVAFYGGRSKFPT